MGERGGEGDGLNIYLALRPYERPYELNDFQALHLYVRLRLAGIRLGRDLSMISFDNRPQMLVHPVSSIDFGFAGLAYAVAHLFNADLPVRVDRRRRIMSTPFVADRGSVGRRPRVVDKKSVGVHRYACENATAIPPAPSP